MVKKVAKRVAVFSANVVGDLVAAALMIGGWSAALMGIGGIIAVSYPAPPYVWEVPLEPVVFKIAVFGALGQLGAMRFFDFDDGRLSAKPH